jgi:tetratricopeptide (TPR) repeat protein
MKNVVYGLILLSFAFTGCSKYGYVNLNYPQEPQVYLPEGVKSIALVNRSLVKEEDKRNNVMESIASAEVAGSDRIASDECLKGVYDGMQGRREVSVIFPEKSRLYGTGSRETPELLNWKRVGEICDSSKADVLLVLENFDSNTDLAMSVATNQALSVLSTGKPTASIPDRVRMNVQCYWRMYDPFTKTIVDQYQHSSYQIFHTEDIIPPLGALQETAYAAGREYIQRFLPSYYTVRRDLYKRVGGSDKHKFKAGYRCAEVANWDEAIEHWNKLTENTKRKTAGRACLDIAVAYEVLGNTDLALKWAKRSYQDYNDKLGRDYAKILLRRKTIEK